MERTVLALAALAALAGCRSEINPAYCAVHSDPRCPATADAPPGDDSFVVPEAGARTCFGGANYLVCLQTLPTSALTISNITLNTSPGSGQCATAQPMGWTSQGQPDACFIIAKTVKIDGTNSTARGTRPLVILATDTVDLTGELDVSAARGDTTNIPAGFDPAAAACMHAAPPGDAANGGGGGAGGTFGTLGGSGGNGQGGALAGSALALGPPPTTLRAGCGGQTGGIGDGNSGGGGIGGYGGGAVLFVAPTINIEGDADIHANGAGGSGGGHHSGGGGAGTGGMIVLWADMFVINASGKLIANGGGGAGGGTNSSGAAGNDPSTSTPGSVATGGSSGGHGGAGFAGVTQAVTGLNGTATNDGGGGGGGGGGYIFANQQLVVNSSPGVTLTN
jgi:hypothetical protein